MDEYDGASDLNVSSRVCSALEEWTTEMNSRFLCVVGPYQMSRPSLTSMTAERFVASAAKAKVPAVSVRCELHDEEPDGSTRETEALISLTYGLIRQLIELLPATTAAKPGLGDRFKKLDESLNTWAEAIAIMKDLLRLSPPKLLCFIDGFERLDDKSTENPLKDFFEALKGRVRADREASGSPGVFKVLFTTAGRSGCLLYHMKEEDLVFDEQPNAARRPGKPSRGTRSFSPTPSLIRFRDAGTNVE